MSLPSSDLPIRATTDTPSRQGVFLTFSVLCASLAVVAGALWPLIMVVVARAVRPPELDGPTFYRGDIAALLYPARVRMAIITGASFLVILALAVVAILLGRRVALLASPQRLELIERLAVGSLLGGLLSGIIVYLANVRPVLPTIVVSLALVSFAAVGIMTSFILSSIVPRRAQGVQSGAAVPVWTRHYWTRLTVVVSLLAILAGFVLVALLAQFVVGFYLHLVY
ncbi:MAG TPA: hypothetical protein VFN11_14120 [Ktedonobacterales bacterium]|nr:hypothetical protein [Ktedonobacterales bacterium]